MLCLFLVSQWKIFQHCASIEVDFTEWVKFSDISDIFLKTLIFFYSAADVNIGWWNKNGCCITEGKRKHYTKSLQISTNFNSSPFFIHYSPRSTLSNVCDSAREKRAKVNRKKNHLLCFWFCGGKKGCGSSNKHSVWICLLGSDDIQWHFNWVLSLWNDKSSPWVFAEWKKRIFNRKKIIRICGKFYHILF